MCDPWIIHGLFTDYILILHGWSMDSEVHVSICLDVWETSLPFSVLSGVTRACILSRLRDQFRNVSGSRNVHNWALVSEPGFGHL